MKPELKLPSEMMYDLCLVLEAYPASEQHTKCSILASELRRELEAYEASRPLTSEENAMIERGLKKFLSASPRPSPHQGEQR